MRSRNSRTHPAATVQGWGRFTRHWTAHSEWGGRPIQAREVSESSVAGGLRLALTCAAVCRAQQRAALKAAWRPGCSERQTGSAAVGVSKDPQRWAVPANQACHSRPTLSRSDPPRYFLFTENHLIPVDLPLSRSHSQRRTLPKSRHRTNGQLGMRTPGQERGRKTRQQG